MPTVKVLVVDYYALMREALKAIIDGVEDVSVIGETVSLKDAMDVVADQKPDVIILSVFKPNRHDFKLVNEIKTISPGTKIVAFTSGRPPEMHQALNELKVSGLLRVDAGIEEIRLAVKQVSKGDQYVDRQIPQMMFNGANPSRESLLSSRQQQILTMIADGFTNMRISAELDISHDTVKTHVRAIFKKLGAIDRAQAVSKAYEFGIIDQDCPN